MTTWTSVTWDTKVFNMDCYEISNLDALSLDKLKNTSGHFTLRVNPLTPTAQIQKFGFRYVDTLIVPVCCSKSFMPHINSEVTITKDVNLSDLSFIARNAFFYGRYHRDGLIPLELAEKRYENWLYDLYRANKIVGIEYQGKLAAFIAIEGSKLVLHAVHSNLRGRGLARYLWTPVCESLFAEGYSAVESSISAANLAAVNLYARLGFKMKSAQDIYHFHNNLGKIG
jgi:ribosomal protein S18 acetylase RimI-like enzyme